MSNDKPGEWRDATRPPPTPDTQSDPPHAGLPGPVPGHTMPGPYPSSGSASAPKDGPPVSHESPCTLCKHSFWRSNLQLPDARTRYTMYEPITNWGGVKDKRDWAEVTAQKDHEGKPPLDYLPLDVLGEVAFAFLNGAHKYGRDNWREFTDPVQANLYIGATLRHISAYQRGEEFNETGIRHLGHAAAGLIIALYISQQGGTDVPNDG